MLPETTARHSTSAQVFTVWRQAARRAALQKQAMLGRIAGVGRPASGSGNTSGRPEAGAAALLAEGRALSQLPSLREALAATQAAFAAVKEYVNSAGQEMEQMRSAAQLRFGNEQGQRQRAVEEVPPGSPAPSSPPPAGSLQSLLALLQQPATGPASQQQQQQQVQQQSAPGLQPLRLPPPGTRAAERDPLSASPGRAAAEPPSPFSPYAVHSWSGIDTGSPAVMRPPSPPLGSPGPSHGYNPARYASPTKLPSVNHPVAIQAEVEAHMAAAAHIAQELEAFEQVRAGPPPGSRWCALKQ